MSRKVQDIYFEGADKVNVQGPIVRINLNVTSAITEEDEASDRKDTVYRLIMPPQAASELHRGLELALRRLVETGFAAKREKE